MPFTTVAWSQSQTATALAAVNAISDPHVTVAGADVRVPDWAPILFGFFANGASLTRCQLRAPSLLANNATPMEIEPYDVNAEPLSPAAFTDLRANPITLVANENLENWITESGGPSRTFGVAFLGDGNFAPVSGPVFTVRTTNGSTLVANGWTNGALTFTDSLKSGEYAIVGMRAISAGLVAARLVISGSAFRPGCVGHDAVGDLDVPIFRYGQLGEWARFANTTPPTVDFLSVSADTAQVVELDLVQVG